MIAGHNADAGQNHEHEKIERPPDSASGYTLAGVAAAEARIAADLELVAARLRPLVDPAHWRALILGGRYGLGEGGLRRRDGDWVPSDDYLFVVLVGATDPGQRHALRGRLAQLAAALASELGVGVAFAVRRVEHLPRAACSWLHAELGWRHRVLSGPPDALAALPRCAWSRLPLAESARRLLACGHGLLLNQERLAQPAPLDDTERGAFFHRVCAAVLAGGEARLALVGQAHPLRRVQLERLNALDLPHQAKFMELYRLAHAQAARLDPRAFAALPPRDWQARAVWLWRDALQRSEAQRLGQTPRGWEAYCRPFPGKGQQGGGLMRHLLLTAQLFGAREWVRHPGWSLRHPRERLLGALPLLLGDSHELLDPAVAAALALPRGADWRAASAAFLALWPRVA